MTTPTDPEPFYQEPPRLTNTFEADAPLRETLERLLPPEIHQELLPSWRELGEAATGHLLDLARQAQAEPPRHVPFDAWGRRVDEVQVSPAWKALQREAASWGLAAIPYEGKLGPFARLHQFALLALYAPSSAVYTCHLAMTDGATRTLLEHGCGELVQRAVPHLTSRDPRQFWTSGQWMTERRGGSDVSGTETQARLGDDGCWRLFGHKWFTSAITSEVALTLARPDRAGEGRRDLALFYLEQHLPDGSRNGIVIERLKDKLGTRALPTAELSLEGTIAIPVGEPAHGVKKIVALLNTTRLHNAINACGMMARLLQLLRDYAHRRVVFGDRLARQPLHRATLADLQVEYEAAIALTFDCARLLGLQESGQGKEDEQKELRLLTPLVKLLTAKQAVSVASEALEGFGGAGYLEDTGLPVWLRDAQVLPIWEGTTNVLSLDALRAIEREGGLEGWLAETRRRLAVLGRGPMADVADALGHHVSGLESSFLRMRDAGTEFTEASARRFAFCLAAVSAAVPLAEQGAWGLLANRGERSAMAARRWVAERIPKTLPSEEAATRLAHDRVLSGLTE